MSESQLPESPPADHDALSRRGLLTSAGVALASGVGLASSGPAVAAEAARVDGGVATGQRGSMVVEFSSRIAQTGSTGESFTSYGFLTRVAGLARNRLFDGSTGTVGAAVLTAYATGELTARVIDQAVHSIDITGVLSVYQRETPGADFSDPSSFKVGAVVARFDVTLLDVLTVFAPAQGLPALTGDMVQTRAQYLAAPFASRRFGERGQRLRFQATGLGALTDPQTLNSLHEIAGSWSVE